MAYILPVTCCTLTTCVCLFLRWQTIEDPDPEGAILAALLSYLAAADDAIGVFWDWVSMHTDTVSTTLFSLGMPNVCVCAGLPIVAMCVRVCVCICVCAVMRA